MHIYIDADAFPNALKDILYRAIARLQVPLTLVAAQYMRIPESDLIRLIVVEGGPDAADDHIVEIMEEGNLVITQDIPLADRVITKGGYALNPRGTMYTAANIKSRLATRDLMDELRSTGVMTGGPSVFGTQNVQAFANALDKFLTKHCRKK